MPEAYYIIPMVAGPYSRTNPQRPMYVDEIRCNWTGHNVDELGIYVCKVNTTEAKHTDLSGRAGVRQLPREYTWDTLIADMHPAARNFVRNFLLDHGLPQAAPDETIGDVLMRVINSGLFSLGNAPLELQFQYLTQAQQNKISALYNKWGIAYTPTDTVKDLSRRGGRAWWNGNALKVEEY